mgnify:CR=1 FL=1
MDDFLVRPVTELRREGWNCRQLSKAVGSGELVRVVRSVYGSGTAPTGREAHLARARAMLTRLGSSMVLSHATAALVHGLSIEVDDPGDVHLTVAPPARGRRRSGYHVHVAPIPAEDVTEIYGLRVTSLERTAADLARVVPFAWGVVAMDEVLRREVDREMLRDLAEAAAHRAGVDTLRGVVEFADGRAQSPAESLSRVSMMRAGIPQPELQFQITNESGWVADSDFAWPDLGVVGEVDGEGKYDEQVKRGRSAGKVVRYQQDRDEQIRQAGWWPTHWGWALVTDVQQLGAQIRGAFAASGAWRGAR